MTLRLQTLFTGLIALLVAALLACAPVGAKGASGGYQLFEPVALADQNAIQLASLENFNHHAAITPECCNAAKGALPSGYTRNADSSIRGPNGGTAYETGHVDAAGNTVFRRDGGGYFTIGSDGRQVTAASPYTSGAPPVHHVCTNKNCVSTANGGPWTPKFEKFFDNAGLNINSEINKIAVPGHRGPHPAAYHQYVFGRLERGTQGLTPNTPAYKNAVTNVLNDIKVEAATPGNQVNRWLTGG